MKRGLSLWLWGTLTLGVLVSTVVAAVTHGQAYDMQSFKLVSDALSRAPLHVYADFFNHGLVRWPYPPAFLPWLWASGRVAAHGGPGFEFMIRVPTILADAAIAWIVQDWLGRIGRSPQDRLMAAALIVLGPSFVVIAGYHGQFDAVAILPGVLAISLWPRMESPQRAWVVGLLIGIGGALKTVPLLLLLALLPTVRSRREVVTLVLAAAIPLLVAFAPFAFAGTLPSMRVLTYHGYPGAGDLSLVVQPDMAVQALGIRDQHFSPLTLWLVNHGTFVIAAGLLAVAAVGWRARAAAPQMAALLWLAVYAFGGNFFFQYLVWGLPFFLMAGYLRSVLIAQLVLIVPTLLFYLGPWHQTILAVLYGITMIGMWGVAVGAFFILAWRLAVESPPALVAGHRVAPTQGP